MNEKELDLLIDTSEEDEKDALQMVYDLGKATKIQISKYIEEKDFSDFLSKFNRIVSVLDGGDDWFLNADGRRFVEKMKNIDLEELRDYSEYEDEAVKELKDDPLIFFLNTMHVMYKGSDKQKLLQFASALSAPLGTRPLNDWGVGKSGSGKSALKRRALNCIPKSMWVKFNSVSEKRLYYSAKKYGSDYYKGKTLYFDEAESSTDKTALLRSLTDPDMSEKFITHQTLDMQSKDKVLDLVIEKPVTVWFTSVEALKDDQLKNRFLISNPDEDKRIDKMVFEHQMYCLKRGIDPDEIKSPNSDAVKRMVIKIVEDTKKLMVLHPYDIEWTKISNRRLLPFFMVMVGIIARIYYKQRRIIGGKYLISTLDDLRIATKIWEDICGTTVYQVSETALELLPKIPDKEETAISRSTLMGSIDGLGRHALRYRTDSLCDAGLVNSKKDKNVWLYWKTKEGNKFGVETKIEHIITEEGVETLIGEFIEEKNLSEWIKYIESGDNKLVTFLNKDLEDRYEKVDEKIKKEMKEEGNIKKVEPYTSYCDSHHGIGLITYEVTDGENMLRYCEKCGEIFEE